MSVGTGARGAYTAGLPAALELVGAVHEEGADAVAAILDPLDRNQLFDLAVSLAALVVGHERAWIANFADEKLAERNQRDAL